MSYINSGASLLLQTALCSFGAHLIGSVIFGQAAEPTRATEAAYNFFVNGGVSQQQQNWNMGLMNITVGVGIAVALNVAKYFARKA